jgi:hypothetical protein
VIDKAKLSPVVEKKLEQLVETWAMENLDGLPLLLVYMVFSSLEKILLDKQKEIQDNFNL